MVPKTSAMMLLLRAFPLHFLQALDWLLNLAERLVALGVCTAVLYLGFRFVSGNASPYDGKLLATMSTNWKVLLIVLIPLFFPTIKKLILEAKKIGPYERDLPGIPDKQDEQRD